MKEQHFIQVFARRMRERVPDVPSKDYIFSKDFYGLLTADEFSKGICTFNDIIRSILIDVYKYPEEWGMLCYESKEFACNAPRIREEAQTTKELLRIGNLFYAISMSSDLVGQSLFVDTLKFKSFKVSKVSILIKKLQEFGFGIQNFDNTANNFEVLYPDNYAVLQIIKAYSLLSSLDMLAISTLILRAEWRYFDDNKGKNFTYNINDFCRGLCITDMELIRAFYDLYMKYGYVYTVEDTGGLQFEPKNKMDKRRLMYIKRERDELSFNIKFDNIDNYVEDFDKATDNVKNKIIDEYIKYPCEHCGRKKCNGGTVFTYSGNKYTKCIISGSVNFNRINDADAQSILQLVELEIKNRVSLVR